MSIFKEGRGSLIISIGNLFKPYTKKIKKIHLGGYVESVEYCILSIVSEALAKTS